MCILFWLLSIFRYQISIVSDTVTIKLLNISLVFVVAEYSITMRFPWRWRNLTKISRSWHCLTINISDTLRDTDSRSGILIGTYTRNTEGCHFKRPWMTYRNFECKEASHSLFATNELLVCTRRIHTYCCVCSDDIKRHYWLLYVECKLYDTIYVLVKWLNYLLWSDEGEVPWAGPVRCYSATATQHQGYSEIKINMCILFWLLFSFRYQIHFS